MKVATDGYLCFTLCSFKRKHMKLRVIYLWFLYHLSIVQFYEPSNNHHKKGLHFKVILCLTFWAARWRAVLWLWSVLLTSAPAFRSVSAQSSLSANTQYISGVLPNWSSLSLRAAFPECKNIWWYFIIVVITNMTRKYIYCLPSTVLNALNLFSHFYWPYEIDITIPIL